MQYENSIIIVNCCFGDDAERVSYPIPENILMNWWNVRWSFL